MADQSETPDDDEVDFAEAFRAAEENANRNYQAEQEEKARNVVADDVPEVEAVDVPEDEFFEFQIEQSLTYDHNGRIEPTIYNATIIMTMDPRYKDIVAYDEFHDYPVIMRSFDPRSPHLKGFTFKKRGEAVDNHHLSSIAASMQAKIIDIGSHGGYETKMSVKTISDTIDVESRRNSFNPLIEMIEMVEWDGVPRLDTYLSDYLGVENNAYHSAVGSIWLIGAIARAYEPGIKMDYILVLTGSQGQGKSKFFQSVAGKFTGNEFHNDLNAACFKSKNSTIDETTGTWINEISELSGIVGGNQSIIKQAITSSGETARKAYRRDGQRYKRSWVAGATCNNDEFIEDNTGGRRYWPVKVDISIDEKALDAVMPQLWAEAAHRYRAMRYETPSGNIPLFLTPEIEAIAFQKQKDVMVHDDIDSISDAIREFVEKVRKDGDGKVGKFGYYTEFHPSEIFEGISGRPAADYIGSGWNQKMNQAIRRIEYLESSPNFSLVKRLGIKCRKIRVIESKFLPEFISRLVDEHGYNPDHDPDPQGPGGKPKATKATEKAADAPQKEMTFGGRDHAYQEAPRGAAKAYAEAVATPDATPAPKADQVAADKAVQKVEEASKPTLRPTQVVSAAHAEPASSHVTPVDKGVSDVWDGEEAAPDGLIGDEDLYALIGMTDPSRMKESSDNTGKYGIDLSELQGMDSLDDS